MNGDTYRELREQSGISLRKLAEILDISPTYISQVETGKEPRGYSRSTTQRFLLAINADKETSRKLLNEWLMFHQSEVDCINEFISSMKDANE